VESRGPGLAVAFAGAVVAYAVNRLVPAAGPLAVAIVLGIVVRAALGERATLAPGLTLASRTVLRWGVVLLGLQLAVADVVGLGWQVALAVVVGVAVSFLVTRWAGRLLGLRRDRALLVATGVSICGASAVAAMNEVADGDRDDVAAAVATVTALGTVAIAVFPLLRAVCGPDPTTYGAWVGASVHEVGQVTAIGGAAGAGVLQVALATKLGRVVLLAPLVALVRLERRGRATGTAPPLLPWFVAGFVVAAAVRATGLLPDALVAAAAGPTNILLAAAMFALGAGVDLRVVARGGWRSLAAGLVGSVALAGVTLATLLVTT